MDGVSTGQVTSTTLTGITPGSHTVLIKLSGYVDASQPVTVTAGQTTPVTQTLIPAMPAPTGPTGQVYFSTTPQGAAIFVDGALANVVTPTIMAIPVGTHQVVFKHAGYNDLQAEFFAKVSSMTTVSKRLTPGSGVIIPITPGTTGTPVVPTVSTTTTTYVTTVPTTVVTTAPGSWSYHTWLPSWVRKLFPTL
ncbi:MAG: PEGA domain-containing protein [Methanomicrobiales archaeon]